MLEEIVIILGEVTKDSTRGIGSNFFKANSWLCAKVFRYMDAYRKGLDLVPSKLNMQLDGISDIALSLSAYHIIYINI